MGWFKFGNFNTDDAEIYVGGQNSFNFARRDRTFVQVPGRNGDLILDNGRYINATVTYKVFIPDEFLDKRDLLIEGLTSQGSGYVKLTDSYYPLRYRMATLDTNIEFAMGQLNKYGTCDIVFDCMPQIFLVAGDEEVMLPSEGGEVEILGKQPSKPLIKLYSSNNGLMTGDISIDGHDFNISASAGVITGRVLLMDCESQIFRIEGGRVVTQGITVYNDFPELDPKNETFTIDTSGMSNLDRIGIFGRWWVL